jgi:hypothetical protein
MPLNVDYIAGKFTIEELFEILNQLEDDILENFVDDLVKFEEEMKKKYGK